MRIRNAEASAPFIAPLYSVRDAGSVRSAHHLQCRFAAMRTSYFATLFSALFAASFSAAQTPTLGLQDGFLNFSTPSFNVQLVKDSQTLYSLKTKDSTAFDFIPADVMTQRQYNGNYHLGDLTFRARIVGSSAWISGDTAAARKNISALSASGSTLAAANLLPTLPSGSLLNITRRWVLEDGSFQLLFDVTNSQSRAVEIGSLGAPLEFNNVCHSLVLDSSYAYLDI